MDQLNLNASELVFKCWTTIGGKLNKASFSLDGVVLTFNNFMKINQLNRADFYSLVSIIIFTCLLLFSTRILLVKLVAQRLNYGYKEQRKLGENGSNLLAYFIFAVWQIYLVQYKYPELLTDISTHWQGWDRTMDVPQDILYLYYGEIAFYCYSAYSVLFIEDKRKDTVAMLLHHVVANSLIIFSLSVRYHLIGLVVLYLHDMEDVLMAVAKVFDGVTKHVQSSICEVIKNVSFVLFALLWLYLRLYVYPQVVLYSSCHVSVEMLGEPDLYLTFNALLFLLFGLNLYWFYYIVLVFVKLLSAKELADSREYDNKQMQKAENHINGKVESRINGKVATRVNGKVENHVNGNAKTEQD